MDSVATAGDISNSSSFAFASKVKDYFQLIKFTLSFTVVFSSLFVIFLLPIFSSILSQFFYYLLLEC